MKLTDEQLKDRLKRIREMIFSEQYSLKQILNGIDNLIREI